MNDTGKTVRLIRLVMMLTVAAELDAADGTRKLVISIPDRKIALIEDGRVVKVYPVAVGAASTPSPKGSFHISSRLLHPTWYQPGKVVPPGPANPLGTRWMGLGFKGYGIHGTNMPLSIGKAASHGCIRMRNRDVEELYALVQIGDSVELVTEVSPDLVEAFSGKPPFPHVETPAATAAVASDGGVQ